MKTFFLKCLTVLEAWRFAADSPEWKWMRSFSSGSALASSKLPFSCPSGRKWGVSYYEVEKSSRTREDSAEKHLRMSCFVFFFSCSSIPITVFCFLFFGNKPAHRNAGILKCCYSSLSLGKKLLWYCKLSEAEIYEQPHLCPSVGIQIIGNPRM